VTTEGMVAAVRAAGAPVLVLLSGGRDSVCLLDLAVRAHGRAAAPALHVNYGLRADADGDESHCRAVCRSLGVELTVVRAPAAPARGNVQAWARDLRYGEAVRAARGALVATAHTADDQAETVLYRLAAAPGRRALLGMRPRDGRLVRPLLAFTRADTTAWCEAHGLTWRDDASNEGERFARARVRHGLLPALRAIHPAAAANVVRTAALLRDEAELLDALVAAELPGDRIALERLRELHPALARLVVQRLADRAAGALVPGAARRAEEILGLGEGALDVGGGVRAVVERGVLRFGPSEGAAARRSGAPTTQGGDR
jgi:tRNA(Ile)-lysidine synthase